MCIVHKGFRGYRAASHALILGGKLNGLKTAIPYDTIHSPLMSRKKILPHVNDNSIRMPRQKDGEQIRWRESSMNGDNISEQR